MKNSLPWNKKMTASDNPASDVMIEMIKVSKKYPPDVKALSSISLTVYRGEMFFLIGMSGAGKTTLLKLLCNMESPSNGLIEVSGQQIHTLKGVKLARLRQKIGVAYQDFKLLTDRTVAENIAISMEVSYKKPQIIRKRVKDLLVQLQLAEKHNTITGELSRGEQQRVALARAVANSPSLILGIHASKSADTLPATLGLMSVLYMLRSSAKVFSEPEPKLS